MQILRNPIFLISAGIFWITYTLEYFKIFTWPFVHYYLDDVLAMPVILTLTVAVQRQWIYRNSQYVLSKTQVIFAVVYLSIWFEGVLPALSDKYTRDAWDVVAYVAGSCLFYKFINRPISVSLPH
ncbi:magnesium citrate secondary transporter [Adhaeribacter swui]|uniref:Magnesium citrate secondary transporter n=1 Tax=Adhaeribacter swui TaxID=2086471 RepID=A0A7G7G7N9_9BACT|nr:magnesium citrate secondary transporter [Adhaeribacter swui]QNF33173.1 magnesium citrate secondary transporter [Adhaeribacter swui]